MNDSSQQEESKKAMKNVAEYSQGLSSTNKPQSTPIMKTFF